MYEAPFGEIALFWGDNPVALFSNLKGAIRYIYHEFYEAPFEWDYKSDEEEDEGFDWII